MKSFSGNKPYFIQRIPFGALLEMIMLYIFLLKKMKMQLFKDALSDMEFVNAVETVYQNWVLPGTHKERGYSDELLITCLTQLQYKIGMLYLNIFMIIDKISVVYLLCLPWEIRFTSKALLQKYYL